MSTRGAIARVKGDGFEGVYHHWDSYPEALGKTLWELYHGHFKEDLGAMLSVLIDQHPAGWSTLTLPSLKRRGFSGYAQAIASRYRLTGLPDPKEFGNV